MPGRKNANPPISVYFTREERQEVQELADLAGISRGSFIQYGIRYFVAEYKKNKKVLKVENIQVAAKPE